jgi:hypothetical protein
MPWSWTWLRWTRWPRQWSSTTRAEHGNQRQVRLPAKQSQSSAQPAVFREQGPQGSPGLRGAGRNSFRQQGGRSSLLWIHGWVNPPTHLLKGATRSLSLAGDHPAPEWCKFWPLKSSFRLVKTYPGRLLTYPGRLSIVDKDQTPLLAAPPPPPEEDRKQAGATSSRPGASAVRRSA